MKLEDQDQESTAEPVGQTTTSVDLEVQMLAAEAISDQERKVAILAAEPVEDLEVLQICSD